MRNIELPSRSARQLEPRENVEAERSKIRKLVDGVSGGP